VTRLLFENASVLDAERGAIVPDQTVLVEDARVLEVDQSPARWRKA
jgi:hypothetical protein